MIKNNDKKLGTFENDLEEAHKAENICRLVWDDFLKQQGKDCDVSLVSEDKEFYYKGDIQVKDNKSGKSYLLECKNDGRWHETGRILAEDRIWWVGSGKFKTGFMQHGEYTTILYCSKPAQKILVIDFEKWRDCYKNIMCGFHTVIKHRDYRDKQDTWGYLNYIDALIDKGAIKATISFDFSGTWDAPSAVWVTSVENHKSKKTRVA